MNEQKKLTELYLKYLNNFDAVHEVFMCDDAHPESFYLDFYDQYVDNFEVVDVSDKEMWLETFRTYLDDEELPADMEFYEVLDEYPGFKEDVVVWLIDNNPVVKGTATEALWAHIKEAWTIDVLETVIEGRWNGK